MLARLKISCLDAIRDQAKQQYKVHVDSYVRTYLGKPLDKLSVRERTMTRFSARFCLFL